MNINETKYRIALQSLVQCLNVMAGEEDTASVQINSDGDCILRVGCPPAERLNVGEFAKVLDETMVRHLESGGLLP